MSGKVVRRQIQVGAREGLHLRAASVFVQRAVQFQSAVRVEKADQTVNGKSITELLTLAAQQGELLTLEAEGDDALQAVEALVALMESDLEAPGDEPTES